MGDWSTARNVLCVRLDTMGDVLMTTPALRAVKQSARGRRVTLLTSSASAEVARLVPEVGRVIVYDAPWMKRESASAGAEVGLALIEQLRRERFDAAVIFTVYSQSPLPAALACYLADIPLRLAHCRENPYQLLTDHVPEREPGEFARHEVERQLDLVSAVGWRTRDTRLSLRIPVESCDRVLGMLAHAGVDPADPWIILHPGATAASRRYPAEGFADAARRLAAEDGRRVIITGGAAEMGLAEGLCASIGPAAISVAGQLQLGELAALIELAPLLLSNNTGPVHIAAAVGTPVVDVYALTNPQHKPWQVPHRVLSHDVECRWCYRSVCPAGHHACLRGVSPDEVVAAVRELAPRPILAAVEVGA